MPKANILTGKDLESWFFNKKKITDNNCWEWTGTINGGYGKLQIQRKRLLAHRFSLELHLKREIPKNLEVRHMCHNSICINPLHLEEGTHEQNMKDMVVANRQCKGMNLSIKLKGIKHEKSRGEHNHKSKLTEEQVINIINSDKSSSKLSKEYNVSRTHILRIKNKESWKHLT
jgi:hypothetical protein